jgi:hypothetical protein
MLRATEGCIIRSLKIYQDLLLSRALKRFKSWSFLPECTQLKLPALVALYFEFN